MPYRAEDCVCPPGCPERCRPERLCADPACACYQLWELETDLLAKEAGLL